MNIADLSLVMMQITGLLLEVADSPDEVSLSLGAAVLVAKKESAGNWRLRSKNYRELTREERRSQEAKIVDCYLDELFGLHLATGEDTGSRLDLVAHMIII